MKTLIIKSLAIIILVLGLNKLVISSNNKASKNVEITYVANTGFLIEIDNKKVLVDGIFGDKEYGFCDIPNASQLELIKNAKGEFKNIDLVAATHRHIDHFYAPFVIEHLLNNKSGRFVSCEQSITKIKEAENYQHSIKDQLINITPDNLTYKDTVINDIKVRIYRLIHGPYYVDDPQTGKKINRHKNIQNLGYLFNINGVKIFHCGDSSPNCKSEYEHFRLDKENIEIAFLGRGFVWSTDCEGVQIVKDLIKPKHVVLTHIHHDQNQHFIDVAKKMDTDFPSVKVFEKLMETKNYTIH